MKSKGAGGQGGRGEEEAGGTPASRMTPAMRGWAEKLAQGYTIRPVIGRSTYRGTVWRAGLFNPEGRFVQMVRGDTVRRLIELGLVK